MGKIEMTNIVAKIPGAQPDTIILGGHYDTKRMKMRFVGANDGASGTAFLIEMANVLAHREKLPENQQLGGSQIVLYKIVNCRC